MKLIKIVVIFIFLLIVLGLFGYLFSDTQIGERQVIIIPTVTPEPTIVINKNPLSAEKLTALVNNWRVSQGFKPYIKNEDLCRLAKDRADDGVDNHVGALQKYSNYPSQLQENLAEAWIENAILEGWLSSPPHKATLEKPYKYSCIACYKKQCNQIFSNLENGTR